ncbi:maestro heat-like repeat-containing protein family member 2B [Alligator mississippiensis]|uniref:Maestro heat-like repeat-containing protein family member 2B n=1 Tax=Alligator mississippiensis TaxID=8496 RepID=A0A151MVH5_ALLMI|nr:maestro heat-like repeat-containing protein family member 2B [Alligator mississippiensis]
MHNFQTCQHGNPETSQDNVWWEHLLLKFLNMTLKSIDDNAWSSQLSLELQHQTASYACSSPEKSFLYKALGTTLASCQDVAHVKSQLQKSLKGTDYMNASEREHVVTILTFSAKGHLDLTLGTLEDFGAAISKVQVSGIVGRL